MSVNIDINGLVRDWDFVPSRVERWERRAAIESFLRTAHRRPEWAEIKAVSPKKSWVVYFMFSLDGTFSPSQEFTLSRLKDLSQPILVVYSCPDKNSIANALLRYCDALLWKALPGYDFSAYTLALHQISKKSPSADVLVLNDSVFGPFTDLRQVLAEKRWDLTGFTASSQLTNHIQSYAFRLRNVSPQRMMRLSSVFFPFFAMSDSRAVVHVQEIRLARVAARSMKVGAYWFGDAKEVIDPSLVRPIELLDAGFPFLKRSLLGKHQRFIERDLVIAHLEQNDHPVSLT